MNLQLRILAGPDQGEVFPLKHTRPLLIGRGEEADIQLNDLSVSRLHCQLSVQGKDILLQDQSSRSGVFVNGNRVMEHVLQPLQAVQIGATQFHLEPSNIAQQATLMPEQVQPRTQARPAVANPTQAKPAIILTKTRAKPAVVQTPVLTAERLEELTGNQISHFQIGGLLARGQSGLVFEANDLQKNRKVALKVLWPEFTRDEQELQRFIRAMNSVLPLRHPNLVSFHAAGRSGPYCWLAMELVEGQSLAALAQRLKTGGKVAWKNALRVGIYVGRGLDYAHQNSIIHRNVTPRNILMGRRQDICKLSDLMLAKALEGKMAQHITNNGQLLGEVSFMSPERTTGLPTDVDERSDIYSLGATLYSVLAGLPPFQGSSPLQTILQIRNKTPEPLRVHQPGVPPNLEAIIMKMLARDQADRYATAAELVSTLEVFARSQRVDF